MITVKGENYFNDFTRTRFEKSFVDLESLFKWMCDVSDNFNGSDNYFPHIENNQITRISFSDKDNRGWCFWIYEIDNEKGIVYSTGKYTNGHKFCAQGVKRWIIESTNKINRLRNKPNFVEL
jgi:hypothetical protein